MMTKAAAAEVCLEGVTPFRLSLFMLRKRLAMFRCRLIHRSISLPVNGKYRCWTCLQEFETEW